ncbi:MAG: biotin/lipoate A/B protein ligase family protein [Candidatus Saliniplasma sp.]
MKRLRYIPTIEGPAHEQMAIDEAILSAFDDDVIPPTLRFFRFHPSAITIGYSQDIDKVIDTDRCDEYEIPFVRRVTGGGTVYHDYHGEITYSIVTEQQEGRSIQDSFEHLLSPIIETLKDYDLNARFKPYNDILVSKRKVSGSAQRRGKRGLLQHGTLMYATDLEVLSDILLLDEEKLKAKGVGSFFELVTTMEKELGSKPDPEELIQRMKNNYKDYFGAEMEKTGLTSKEKEYVEELKEKYKSKEWTYYRKWE